MRISKVFETDQGKVLFEGDLDESEVTYLLELGLNYMFSRNMIPFKVDPNPADIHDAPGEVQ